jgi:hypothetical protein
MYNPKRPVRRMASRRRVLCLSAWALTLSGFGFARLAVADAPRATQKAVSYQDHPKGGKCCNQCKASEAPTKCKTVEGYVEARGWCDKWVKS